MHMNKQPIGQEATIRHAGWVSFSLKIPLFMIILCFIIGSQIARSQEKSAYPAAAKQTDASAAQPKTVSDAPCTLPPIVVPTLPDKIPGYTELDPETQLHVTGTAQEIDFKTYRLEITGKVNKPIRLTYDDLRCMPKIEDRPVLVCPGFFEDIATWAGASMKYVLDSAGVQKGARSIRLMSADGYAASVSLEEALSEKNFLAYELEGNPIPVLHGFPIRAVFPELQGNRWVKWLIRIEVK